MATTTNGVPYPVGTDNNDTAADLQALAEFVDSRLYLPGDLKFTLDTGTPPTGWLAFGQTVTGAQSLYPDLWAVAPTAWKSGSDLVLPSVTDAQVQLGTANIGQVSGSNSVTISTANLPQHSHSLSHDHTFSDSFSGTTGSDDHSHLAGTLTAANDTHGHSTNTYISSTSAFTGAYEKLTRNIGSGPINTEQDTHGHSISGSTASDTHSHTFSGSVSGTTNLYNGNTGPVGSGTGLDISGKKIFLNIWVRT